MGELIEKLIVIRDGVAMEQGDRDTLAEAANRIAELERERDRFRKELVGLDGDIAEHHLHHDSDVRPPG